MMLTWYFFPQYFCTDDDCTFEWTKEHFCSIYSTCIIGKKNPDLNIYSLSSLFFVSYEGNILILAIAILILAIAIIYLSE